MVPVSGFDLFTFLERKLEERRQHRIRLAILNSAHADSSLQCTSNARVLNHGKQENVVLGAYIILDGTLECYEHGRMEIGPYTFIGRSRLFCAKKISVGAGVMISDNVVIMDSDLHPISGNKRYQDMQEWVEGKFPDVYSNIKSAPVSIGNTAWIGANAVVLKGAAIGEGAIVGAGAVVTQDVPEWTVVAGNPARIIRELAPHER